MAYSDTASGILVDLPADAPIRLFDLQAQQASIRPALEKCWTDILDHGHYIGGPEVEACEQALADFTGASAAITTGSGTQALIMTLLAIGSGPGMAVFIPGFTYNATANAVLLAGASPVIVDIDPETFNIDPVDLERKIAQTKRKGMLTPHCIMPVDLYGLPADYDTIRAIADHYHLHVIADGAQSFGGKYNGRLVGNIAPATALSFYPSKTLGGYGDGGAILCQDDDLAAHLRSIRWHGTDDRRKESVRIGINGRCDSIQCAVIIEKLRLFEEEQVRRAAAARLYNDRLAGRITCQATPPGRESAYGLYTVRVRDRDRVRNQLAQAGIPSGLYYDLALHQMAAFAHYADGDTLPHCAQAARECLSLPMHPYLSEMQIHKICDHLLSATCRD